MTITMENNSLQTISFPCEKLASQVVTAALDAEKFPYEAEVNLLLVDREEMRSINSRQRQIDRPTDVLSFPMVEYPAPGDFSRLEDLADVFHPDTGEAVLGDIVICVDIVKEQALEYGHSVQREFAFLVVHSMLHLMGYDHMTEQEAAVMEAKQEAVLDSLGITR